MDPIGEVPSESRICINSRSDGLFLSRKPNGLGSLSGLYCEGATGNKLFSAGFCTPLTKKKLNHNNFLLKTKAGIDLKRKTTKGQHRIKHALKAVPCRIR